MHKCAACMATRGACGKMWSVLAMFNALGEWMYWCFVGKWLWDFFRHGPAALGCWASAPDQDVCARIAGGTRSADWLEFDLVTPTRACTELIQRTYTSFGVAVHSGLYVLAVVCACRVLAVVAHQRHFARVLALELHTTTQTSKGRG